MEPVTHLLTGACLSRAGFNRKAAYATLTMVVAAEFPDIDKLWGLRGPIEDLQHHRGITHTFLGLPFEAALIVVGVYGFHRWRVARTRRTAATRAEASAMKPLRVKPLTAAPVRWGVLYGLALVALLSHLLLDYTNNYGLRPFFPFNDHWYAASIVFIFDPVMFVLLAGALVAPWLFGLVNAEVGAKRQSFRGRGWAIAALIGVVGWWGLRAVEHRQALQMTATQSMAAPTLNDASGSDASGSHASGSDETSTVPAQDAAPVIPIYLPVRRALASPDMLSPFRWSAVMDFGPVYRLAEVDTLGDTLVMGETNYPKPGRSAIVLAAEASRLGSVYMDWSPMPFVEVTRPDSVLASGSGSGPDAVTHVVTFRDPRFMGGWLQDAGRQPLVGIVSLDAQNHVVEESLDGRRE